MVKVCFVKKYFVKGIKNTNDLFLDIILSLSIS